MILTLLKSKLDLIYGFIIMFLTFILWIYKLILNKLDDIYILIYRYIYLMVN